MAPWKVLNQILAKVLNSLVPWVIPTTSLLVENSLAVQAGIHRAHSVQLSLFLLGEG